MHPWIGLLLAVGAVALGTLLAEMVMDSALGAIALVLV
jgi:hypothetical protein